MDIDFRILLVIAFAAVILYSLIGKVMQAPLRQQAQAVKPILANKTKKFVLIYFYSCIRANLIATVVLYTYITASIRSLRPYFESPAYVTIQDKSEVLAILTGNIGLWPMLALSICHTLFPPPLIAAFGAAQTADGVTQLRWLYAGYVYAAVWLVLLRLGYADNYVITILCVGAGAVLIGNHANLVMQNTRAIKKLTQ